MKPIRLYIDNFMCYDKSFIDFTQFSAALIIGIKENNELVANAVGKTTIFKALEYVLFNQSDSTLDRIIRDDTDMCQLTLDFLIGNQEYRLVRKRTKKGSVDVTLLQRNSVQGEEEDIYHSKEINNNYEYYSPLNNEKYWKDISGRRTSDTEKELEKLIKLNYKAFRSTIHFIQNDFNGLPTATPERRKAILKEALNLIIYSKLEKIAKERAAALSKEIEKLKLLIDNLGDPDTDLFNFVSQLSKLEVDLVDKNNLLIESNMKLDVLNSKILEFSNIYSTLEGKFSSLLSKEQSLSNDKNRLEISVKEYNSKKNNIIKVAKDLIQEIELLKENQSKLIEIDYSQIDIIIEQINIIKNKVAHNNVIIQNNLLKYEELKIPVPDDSVCKHCRQTLTKEHKLICKTQINKEMENCQIEIKNSKKEIANLNSEILSKQQTINSLNLSKQQLENINTKISSKNKEVIDKKSIHNEYSDLFNKFSKELDDKKNELQAVNEELKLSSLEEAKVIKEKINEEKVNIMKINNNINLINKEIAHLNATKAVIQHNIEQKSKDKIKLLEFKNKITDLNNKISIFPTVLQSFSSTGIPNLIIQNVLDDLQVEANQLLNKLKPGLQLSFFVEKTIEKTGDQADTLDINYQDNGRERYYEQLSGAQKLSVLFSLKLGLSFVLQKIIGVDFKFLLLDEIDQPLDKASIDSFSEIIKFFQQEYTILIITHNDRLKDKFSHAILVEQDINTISRAKVVSSN